MASAYGPWVATDDWRSWVGVTIDSQNATQAVIKVQGWFQSQAGSSIATGNVKGRVGCGIGNATPTWSSWVTIDPFSSNSSKYYISSWTYTVTKTHDSQTVWGYAEVKGFDGIYKNMSSYVYASVSVGPKTSYTISYNANGGSGAPASQTKWHGETLALSSAKPTRANYNFKGWSTSSTATTATYSAGQNYTGDAALNLYAVWELAYISPTLNIVAYRSNSDGTRNDESTSNITLEYSWSLDQSHGTNTTATLTPKLGSSQKDNISISGETGSNKAVYSTSLVANSTLKVSATLVDSKGASTTRSVTVGRVAKPFSMTNAGMSAAFFGMADAAWDRILKIFGRLAIDGRSVSYVEGAKGNAGIRFYKQATGADQWNPCAVIQTKGGGSWTVGNYNGEELRFVYFTKANIDSSTNTETLNMSLGTTQKSWHKAISGWNVITTTTGTTAKTFSNLKDAGYSEVLIVGTYTTSASYGGSVVIPIDQLSTTERDWYLGGGHWSAGWGAACKLSLTKMTPYQVRYNGNNGNGTWTLYAR